MGASLMKTPPLDQSSAAPATARMALRGESKDASLTAAQPARLRRGAQAKSLRRRRPQQREAAVRRHEEDGRIVEPIEMDAPDPLPRQAFADRDPLPLLVAGLPDQKAAVREA